jgi:putative ABC transport system permease protein
MLEIVKLSAARSDLGFDPRHVLTAQMTLDNQRYDKTTAVPQLEEQVLARLESLPGVEVAATVSNLPFDFGPDMNFEVEENPSGGDPSGSTEWRAITPHYMQLMRIPVVRGRNLTDRDNASGAPVVLINQALAESAFSKVKTHWGSTFSLVRVLRL